MLGPSKLSADTLFAIKIAQSEGQVDQGMTVYIRPRGRRSRHKGSVDVGDRDR